MVIAEYWKGFGELWQVSGSESADIVKFLRTVRVGTEGGGMLAFAVVTALNHE